MNQELALSTIVECLSKPGHSHSLNELNANAKYLIDNVDSVRKLLNTTLLTYEQDYFHQEWEYIEPFLNTSAAHFQDIASRSP